MIYPINNEDWGPLNYPTKKEWEKIKASARRAGKNAARYAEWLAESIVRRHQSGNNREDEK